MNKIAVLAFASSAALVLPKAAYADDRQLEKRLEALEAKMERMAAIEAENKELKARLQKTEAKLEKVTAQKVATIAPGRTVERPAAPVALTTPVIEKETSVTPVSTQSNWSGVYAGINAGYGTGQVGSQNRVIDTNIASSSGPGPQYIKSFGTSSVEGPVVGGQIGINYKLKNNIILGIETDFDYADINNRLGSGYANSNITSVSSTFAQYGSSYARSGIDWLGTARLRFGYGLGNFMPYITGGFAYGGVSSDILYSGISGNASTSNGWQSEGVGGNNNAGNNSSVQVGWAAGAGAELIVAENISIRGEYLFSQLGSFTSYSNNISSSTSSIYYNSWLAPIISSNTGISSTQSRLGPIGIHQARVGLNYHTDWLKNFSVNTEQR